MTQFNKVLNQLKIGYEDLAKRRHKITLHSFRRAYKTIISNMGYSEFSEWALNHSGSPYYQVPEKEKYELFRKIEPYITFLDQNELKSSHADLKSRLESIEQENTDLRQDMNRIMEMIQQNPLLANVKPDILTKKLADNR
jgi:hypothetical protein